MVAAIRAAASSAAVVRKSDDLPGGNPTRPPLGPSEKDNAGASRRPRAKEVTSRYLSYSSSPTSTSTATSSAGMSSSSSSSGRRCPSTTLTPRPSTPAQHRRSQSVDRARPSTPRRAETPPPQSAAARELCTTTRSLSVSFQGDSFFYQTSKAKTATPAGKPSPDRRRSATPSRTPRADIAAAAAGENARPLEQHRRWPAAKALQSNPLTRSLDCSLEKKEPMLAVLRQSMVFDGGASRSSFDAGDLSASSKAESLSSGFSSGVQDPAGPLKARAMPKNISVPARFWQETNSRLRRLPQSGSPIHSPTSRTPAPPKLSSGRQSLLDSPISSPRTVSSPLRGPVRPSSPSRPMVPASRAVASPLRGRGGAAVCSTAVGQLGNAMSISSFAAEVRRSKKSESRIEEACLLSLYDNRHVQWRWVNARADAALLLQRLTAEKNLYNAWMAISEMHDSVTIKRMKLQLLNQKLKLTSILKGQMTYLEELSLIDKDHSSFLSGAAEALKASTLRLPVVGGAKADLQEVKDAVGSAIDVMQTMGSSICSLLSKVEGTGSLASELAEVGAKECALLNQSRELLSTVAAMHVKQCSLQGHLLQLKRKPSQLQL